MTDITIAVSSNGNKLRSIRLDNIKMAETVIISDKLDHVIPGLQIVYNPYNPSKILDKLATRFLHKKIYNKSILFIENKTLLPSVLIDRYHSYGAEIKEREIQTLPFYTDNKTVAIISSSNEFKNVRLKTIQPPDNYKITSVLNNIIPGLQIIYSPDKQDNKINKIATKFIKRKIYGTVVLFIQDELLEIDRIINKCIEIDNAPSWSSLAKAITPDDESRLKNESIVKKQFRDMEYQLKYQLQQKNENKIDFFSDLVEYL